MVKGIQRSPLALTCALNDRCLVAFNGSGFESGTDQLKMIPSGVPCGGDVLRVTGDGSNGTGELLGLGPTKEGCKERREVSTRRALSCATSGSSIRSGMAARASRGVDRWKEM